MITLLRTKEKQNCISDQTCDQKVIWFQVSVNDSKRVKVFNRKDRLGKVKPGEKFRVNFKKWQKAKFSILQS